MLNISLRNLDCRGGRACGGEGAPRVAGGPGVRGDLTVPEDLSMAQRSGAAQDHTVPGDVVPGGRAASAEPGPPGDALLDGCRDALSPGRTAGSMTGRADHRYRRRSCAEW